MTGLLHAILELLWQVLESLNLNNGKEELFFEKGTGWVGLKFHMEMWDGFRHSSEKKVYNRTKPALS